jgi:hypothetical protein
MAHSFLCGIVYAVSDLSSVGCAGDAHQVLVADRSQLLYPLTGVLKMSNRMKTDAQMLTVHEAATYQIRVQGTVGDSWSDYYAGMTIDIGDEAEQRPVTTLTGQLQDQAALIGALTCLYDMRLPILSVEHLPDK